VVFDRVFCLVEVAHLVRSCLGQAEAVDGRSAHRMLGTLAATVVALSVFQKLCISALSEVAQAPCRVIVSLTIFPGRSCRVR
jgi:hypothetical protein